jgi:histidine kinase
MIKQFFNLRRSLVAKLTLTVGIVLLISISTWAYFNIDYQKKKLMDNVVNGSDRLINTIRLGTHYAMMLNSRDDINQIINNIGRQKEIENIRIYNKEGQVKFSNHPAEVDLVTNIEAEACYICHRTEPPLDQLDLIERVRIFSSSDGYRLLGIISPVRNEPGCSTGECHFHPKGKKILGALDLVISLKDTDEEIARVQRGIIGLTIFVFSIISAIILVFLLRFVNLPIGRLIKGTQRIAKGEYSVELDVKQNDEMGLLAQAVTKMGKEIEDRQTELNRQRDEYQEFFERVPCLITIQDRGYKLLRYNNEFAQRFNPTPGDYCYHAYKGRDSKCDPCPVEKTFQDGQPQYTEETGYYKDGTSAHWIVRTSPIFDAKGDIVAAMEISHDITERRKLEVELAKSEKKYHAIFNNIPNPVFVLDRQSFEILDCNMSVDSVYGYSAVDLVGTSFLNLFPPEEQKLYAAKLKTLAFINQATHRGKNGHSIFVNIRISPSEYSGRKVILVTTSDITKRREAEQQLIQASKMATLGEMATGVAHELNQPLSVIKTVSSFFVKKLTQKEALKDDVLETMLSKVDTNVDRATKIINHMRQFARKSESELTRIQVNEVLESAFEIFSQQLKTRGIAVDWKIDDHLPKINADPGRLEQVFINLLLNARDAVEMKWLQASQEEDRDDRIVLESCLEGEWVVCRISDSGIGIPPQIANKIFEPFFTTKEVGKGTGLGLSISYGIIKECRGEIRVIPKHEKGTCFEIRFPVDYPGNSQKNSEYGLKAEGEDANDLNTH